MSKKKLIELCDSIKPILLPIGVYVTARDGEIVMSNTKVQEILDLDKNSEEPHFITDFYVDPQLRKDLYEKLIIAEKSGKFLSKEILPLRVSGRELFVEDYTRTLRDEVSGEVLGFLCCMVDYTEEERFQRLFDESPAGVYRFDRHDRLVKANKTFVKMHGYESLGDMIGIPASSLHSEDDHARDLRELLRQSPTRSLVNKKFELLRKNGETFFASITTRMISDGGNYAGREGTVLDISDEEYYRQLLDELPIGLFRVEQNGPDRRSDSITHCNEKFAQLNGFSSRSTAIGSLVSKLHPSEKSYIRFLDALIAEEQKGEPLLGFELEIVRRDGQKATIEVNAKFRKDKQGRPIERIGAIRDITKESRLRTRVRELTSDIGQVLHTYSQTLMEIRQHVDPIIDLLSNDFGTERSKSAKEVDVDDVLIDEVVPGFVNLLSELFRLRLENAHYANAWPEDQWGMLEEVLDWFTSRELEERETRYVFIRDYALAVSQAVGRVKRHTLPRELLKDIARTSRNLASLGCLLSLYQIKSAVLEMEHPTRMLRSFVLTDMRPDEGMELIWLGDLISEAVRKLASFAVHEGVELKRSSRRGGRVLANREEIFRATVNILHNAIKYSWQRSRGEVWVKVGLSFEEDESQTRFAAVVVENWGVPIPEDEHELIFDLGYRGRLSGDRRRPGTGVGLSDARRMARRAGGDVVVLSRPARSGGDPGDFDQPFITTAKLLIPIVDS